LNSSIDNQELSELLLDYADNLEIRDKLGWTPLITAVGRGSKENVKVLLKRGAKIDCDYLGGMNLIATAMGYNDIGMNNIKNLSDIYF
jgi:ankyrin repeat protein